MSKNYQRGLAIAGLLAVVALVGGIVQMDAVHHAAGGAGFVAMAVVIGYGSGARDPSSLKAIDGINAAAEVRRINSLIAIANGDSIGSKYMIGEVPADAIIDPLSSIVTTAITSATDNDIGLAYPNGGAMIVADCIVNGQTLAAAATVSLAAATGSGVATPANMKKRAWELAGLSANPGGNLALWLTLNVAATAAGSVWSNISYSKGA
ncbi:hypothetical protein IVB40_07625 [Bradyrhizobium sp. 40]|uniref:hypothetical protein n=1 Tax=Bradyrhizobium sp. 40 TaxID=2782674 RepID=UPI001FFE5303|nr:hypothetical protein [Bradyrhizobium sp. 40]UPJ43930.1 hypothetical protein IVB40_07625 [Bradyrhizobium sp. 40]